MTDSLDVINKMTARLTCEIGLDTFYKRENLATFPRITEIRQNYRVFCLLVFPHFLVTVTVALILRARLFFFFFVRCYTGGKPANAHAFPFELVKSAEFAFEKPLVSRLILCWPPLRLGLH